MAPVLFAEGIFMDGEIYAVLARNYAAGLGDLWNPHFSSHLQPQWHEHPPAGLWFMSVGYHLLGDHMYVERLHSLLTAVICGWLIVLVWRRLLRDDSALARLGWLPLLLWLMNPQVTWAYSNAMLENTSSIFVVAAFLAIVRALEQERFPWAWSLAIGGAVVGAVLVKGPVGLFPLAAVGLSWLVRRRPGLPRAAGITLVMTAVVVAVFAALWQWPSARLAFEHYLDQQLFASLSGKRGGSPDPLHLIRKIWETLLPAVGLVVILVAITWRRSGRAAVFAGHGRTAVWLLLVALSGSLPLGLSPRNSLFYLLPSFPFFALGLAMLAAPATNALLANLRPGGRAHRGWLAAGALILCGALVFGASRIGTYGRSPQMRKDIKLVNAYLAETTDATIGAPTTVSMCGNLRRAWALQTSLCRYGPLAPECTNYDAAYLIGGDDFPEPDLADWVRVPLATTTVHLFERAAAD